MWRGPQYSNDRFILRKDRDKHYLRAASSCAAGGLLYTPQDNVNTWRQCWSVLGENSILLMSLSLQQTIAVGVGSYDDIYACYISGKIPPSWSHACAARLKLDHRTGTPQQSRCIFDSLRENVGISDSMLYSRVHSTPACIWVQSLWAILTESNIHCDWVLRWGGRWSWRRTRSLDKAKGQFYRTQTPWFIHNIQTITVCLLCSCDIYHIYGGHDLLD